MSCSDAGSLSVRRVAEAAGINVPTMPHTLNALAGPSGYNAKVTVQRDHLTDFEFDPEDAKCVANLQVGSNGQPALRLGGCVACILPASLVAVRQRQ